MADARPGTCPSCGVADDFTVPSVTWWGGIFGHRILSHVNCNQCGAGFNSNSGRSNTLAISLYLVFFMALLIPAFYFLMS